MRSIEPDFESAERRSEPLSHGQVSSDILSVNREEKVFRINGEPVRLTRTEFRLLLHLVERPMGWVTAGDLIRDVLGTHHRPDTPLVRVHVHAVRRKLGPRASWLESDPHRLRGYRWVGPAAD